ncbi:MAG TPA: hypothetical protein VJL85_02515 [Gaiellaceae bacterium]|jgi:hypothetical protein|nr:hypothetical protein [Gaiellaceae bacterium]
MPSGWEPPDDFSREGLLRPPRFVDKQTLVVDLPTGEERSFTL